MARDENNRTGMRIKDRSEFKSKPKPLTFGPDTTVIEAVKAMHAKNYGSVAITDPDEKVIGMVTERDIMTRLVCQGKDAKKTKLSEIMTTDLRVANEEDDLVDWLRVMSNERFRRLPVIDDNGRIKAIFTQGDFVSYTWPDLIYQAKEIGKATLSREFNPYIIGAAILIYTLLMAVVFKLT